MHHLEKRVGPAKSLVFFPMQIPFFLPLPAFVPVLLKVVSASKHIRKLSKALGSHAFHRGY